MHPDASVRKERWRQEKASRTGQTSDEDAERLSRWGRQAGVGATNTGDKVGDVGGCGSEDE